MRRNKESDIEKERKAPDNSFRNNRRKAPANPGHTNAYPACRTTAVRPFILEAKVKRSIRNFRCFPTLPIIKFYMGCVHRIRKEWRNDV